MKKILILALVAIFMLPVLPAFAADYTTVSIADLNGIDSDLKIEINASEGFVGAEINVADQVFHSYDGSGAGVHTVNVPLDDLYKEGEVLVNVNALYDGFNEEITKTVTVSKITVTEKVVDTPTFSDKLGFRGLLYGNDGNSGTGGIFPEDNPDYWGFEGYAQVDLTPAITPALKGIVKYSFDFKCDEPLTHIRVRMTANVSNGAAFSYGASSPEAHYNILKGTNFGANKVPYSLTDWNHVEMVFNLYTNTFDAYINGTLGESSSFTTTPGTNDFIADTRSLFSTAGRGSYIYLDNFKLEATELKDSWNCESANYDGEKISLTLSDDVDGLTATDFKLVNSFGDEVAISSVDVVDGGYEITPAKDLLYGAAYKVLVKNGTKSVSGYSAFKETDVDKDGDGYFAFAMVKTPKYALNVDYVEDNGSGYNVFFNNTDISDKFVAICWYGENGDLVDFDIKAATEVYSGEYISLYRSNATEAANAKVNVFRFDTDSESANYGEFDVIEIYNID